MKNNEKIDTEDNVFFEQSKKISDEIKPEKALLLSILDKVQMESVTNEDFERYTSVKTNSSRKGFVFDNFINKVNHMNNYIKILSGGAVVSALIITLVLINKNDTSTTPRNIAKVTETRVEIGGEVLDVDSFIADISNIDAMYEEPTLNDSDLVTDLINSNQYDIQ